MVPGGTEFYIFPFFFFLFCQHLSGNEWNIVKSQLLPPPPPIVKCEVRWRHTFKGQSQPGRRHGSTRAMTLPVTRDPAQLAGWWGKGIEIVYSEEKVFGTGPTRAAKAEQKFLALARQAQRTNQGKTPFILYSLSPHHLSFNSESRGPFLFSLSAWDYCDDGRLHTFRSIPVAAPGTARISQLSSSCQGRQYGQG